MIKTKQINLISGEFLKKSLFARLCRILARNKKIRNFAILLVALAAFSILQLAALGALKWQVAGTIRRAQEVKVEFSQLQSRSLQLEKQKSELVKEEGIKKQKLEQLLSSAARERKYVDILTLITGLLPPELWINQLVLSDSGIQIMGTTLNPQSILKFMDQLDKSGVFRNSRFISSEKQMLETHVVHNFQVASEPVWSALAKLKEK